MWKHATLILILGIAVLLRLPLLSGSFWLDEAAQALESSRPLRQQHHIAHDFQPPLLHYLVHFMVQVNRSEWWLRLVSLVAGVVTIGVVYRLLQQKVNDRYAVIGSLLLATSPFHIFFSQELRPYALAACFGVLSWYFLLTDRHKKWQIGFIIASVLGLYSMYVYGFNLLAQLLFVGRERQDQLGRLKIALGVVVICYTPWLPFLIEQIRIGMSLKATLPGWSTVVSLPQMKALPLTLAKFFTGQVEIAGSPVRMALYAIPVFLALFSVVQVVRKKETRYVTYWVLVPFIATWLVSFVVPVIAPKRLLTILPGILMAVTLWTHRIEKSWLRTAIIGIFFAVHLFSYAIYLVTPSFQRENWRGLTASIEAQYPTDSRVVFAFDDAFAPWRWYSTGTVPYTATGSLYLHSSQDLGNTLSTVQESTLLVFDYLRDLTDPNNHLTTYLIGVGYQQTGLIDGGDIGFVRIFQKQ